MQLIDIIILIGEDKITLRALTCPIMAGDPVQLQDAAIEIPRFDHGPYQGLVADESGRSDGTAGKTALFLLTPYIVYNIRYLVLPGDRYEDNRSD